MQSTRVARPYKPLNIQDSFGYDVNIGHCGLICPLPLPAILPPALVPTQLQQRVPHEPWMDLFPLSVLRFNLIEAEESFELCDFCFDILGALVEKNIPGIRNSDLVDEPDCYEAHDKGLIIWGVPWLTSSWGFSERSWRKWRWQHRGCGDDILQSTNRYRAAKGENAFT